ncbi:MAG: hypothetical protein ACYC6I_07990 [Bacillota bacterium]
MGKWTAPIIAIIVVVAAGWVLTSVLGLAWFLAAGAIRGLLGLVVLAVIGYIIYSLFARGRQRV